MISLRLDILLDHLNLNCRYHLEDCGGTWCERAWANDDKDCLKYTNCGGYISKCELTMDDIVRNPQEDD